MHAAGSRRACERLSHRPLRAWQMRRLACCCARGRSALPASGYGAGSPSRPQCRCGGAAREEAGPARLPPAQHAHAPLEARRRVVVAVGVCGAKPSAWVSRRRRGMGLPATALLMVYASVQCDWQAAWARTVVGPAHDEGDEEQRQEHEDEPCASAGAGAVARGPHAPRQRRERAACARATQHSRRHARAPARTRAGGQAYAARRHVKCGCSMPHDAPCATCVRVQAALAHAARSASTAVVVGAHHGERSAARLRVGPPVFGLPASATCDEATGTPQAASLRSVLTTARPCS